MRDDDVNENDVRPDRPILLAKENSNLVQDNSINKTMPWIGLSMLIAGIALGSAIGSLNISMISREDAKQSADYEKARALDAESQLKNRMTVAENHFRNGDSEMIAMKARVQQLEISYARHR